MSTKSLSLSHYSEQILDLIDKYYQGTYIEPDIDDILHVDYTSRSKLDDEICNLLGELLHEYNDVIVSRV